MTAILSKKVLLGLGVIGFIAAVVAGATYAAWQASDEITGNTVSTAVLSIDASGVGTDNSDPAPINFAGALPGDISSPEDRAIITNNSDVALDLYMYFENTEEATCAATKVAWQSSVAGGGPVLFGYPIGPLPDDVGTIAGVGDFNFTIAQSLEGPSYVQLADSADFEPGETVALRELAGLATDADYGTHSGTCQWKEVFVGTLPGELPEII